MSLLGLEERIEEDDGDIIGVLRDGWTWVDDCEGDSEVFLSACLGMAVPAVETQDAGGTHRQRCSLGSPEGVG